MERLFILGADHQAGSSDLPYQHRFRNTGKNTGNLLIGNGLYRQLRYARWGGGSIANSPENIRENFDRIVLPAANFLHSNFDFSHWARVVESVDLPCFMAGLGAQAPSDRKLITDIPKGTVRFIKAVAERSRSIGVRGYYTAAVLEKFRITNIDIVGCPSFYTNLSEPICIKKKLFKDIHKVVVTGSSNVIPHSYNPVIARQVECKLFRMADVHDFYYVLQSEASEILYLEHFGETQKSTLERSAKILNYSNADEFASVIRRIGKVFFDVQEWLDWMTDRDLVIGTRLHGAIAGSLRGVPAIIIFHDARTKEISELMHFPRISLSEAQSMSLEAIYEQIDFQASNRRHMEMLCRYIKFIEKNGMQHNFDSCTKLAAKR